MLNNHVESVLPESLATPILDVSGFAVRYGKVEALHDARVRVGAGQIVTVIGPNGAGKSTLLNGLMGALPSSGQATGSVRYLGERIEDLGIEARVARGMCLVPESANCSRA